MLSCNRNDERQKKQRACRAGLSSKAFLDKPAGCDRVLQRPSDAKRKCCGFKQLINPDAVKIGNGEAARTRPATMGPRSMLSKRNLLLQHGLGLVDLFHSTFPGTSAPRQRWLFGSLPAGPVVAGNGLILLAISFL